MDRKDCRRIFLPGMCVAVCVCVGGGGVDGCVGVVDMWMGGDGWECVRVCIVAL